MATTEILVEKVKANISSKQLIQLDNLHMIWMNQSIQNCQGFSKLRINKQIC